MAMNPVDRTVGPIYQAVASIPPMSPAAQN
jgi:hypothetical protein